MEDDQIKQKTGELQLMTNQLKSHIYLNEIFVDPEHNFELLLQKIIKFFESDDLILNIKQNEVLYHDFKKKYEDASQLIKTYENSKYMRRATITSVKNSPIQEEDGTPKIYKLDTNFNDYLELTPTSLKRTSEFNIGDSINYNEKNYFNIKNKAINYADFQLLKEDYIKNNDNLKNLEKDIEDKNKIITNLEKNGIDNIKHMETINELNYTNNKLQKTKETLQIRNDDLNKEKAQLLNNLNTLSHALNMAEREKNTSQYKVSGISNKIKKLDKENHSNKTKMTQLNNKVLDLEDQNCELEEELENQIKQKCNFQNKYEEKLRELEELNTEFLLHKARDDIRNTNNDKEFNIVGKAEIQCQEDEVNSEIDESFNNDRLGVYEGILTTNNSSIKNSSHKKCPKDKLFNGIIEKPQINLNVLRERRLSQFESDKTQVLFAKKLNFSSKKNKYNPHEYLPLMSTRLAKNPDKLQALSFFDNKENQTPNNRNNMLNRKYSKLGNDPFSCQTSRTVKTMNIVNNNTNQSGNISLFDLLNDNDDFEFSQLESSRKKLKFTCDEDIEEPTSKFSVFKDVSNVFKVEKQQDFTISNPILKFENPEITTDKIIIQDNIDPLTNADCQLNTKSTLTDKLKNIFRLSELNRIKIETREVDRKNKFMKFVSVAFKNKALATNKYKKDILLNWFIYIKVQKLAKLKCKQLSEKMNKSYINAVENIMGDSINYLGKYLSRKEASVKELVETIKNTNESDKMSCEWTAEDENIMCVPQFIHNDK